MNDSLPRGKVRIPLSRRWQIWRRRVLPLAVWLTAVGVAMHLMNQQTQRLDIPAVLDTSTTSIIPLVDGSIYSLNVDLYDTVTAGQVVGLLDDATIRAELMAAERELDRLHSTLTATAQTTRRERRTLEQQEEDDLRRFIQAEEQARLDLLDRIVTQEADMATLQRLKAQLDRLEPLESDYTIDYLTIENLRRQLETLKTKVEENKEAIRVAREQLQEKTWRRQERENMLHPDYDPSVVLQPLRDAIQVQQAAIEQISARREQLVLKSPLSGKVTQMLHRSGESVMAGDPLLMISSPQSSRLIAYVDEETVGHISVGQPVEVYSHHQPQDIFEGKVVKISAAMEELPIRLRQNPIMPQWGLPVMIGQIPEEIVTNSYPGERFYLRLLSRN